MENKLLKKTDDIMKIIGEDKSEAIKIVKILIASYDIPPQNVVKVISS